MQSQKAWAFALTLAIILAGMAFGGTPVKAGESDIRASPIEIEEVATTPAALIPAARVSVYSAAAGDGYQQFTATAFDEYGGEIPGAVFEWSLRRADGTLFEMRGITLTQSGLLSVGAGVRLQKAFFVRATYILME